MAVGNSLQIVLERLTHANKKDALGEASSLYMIIIILKGRKYEIILGEIVHTSKIPLACL